MCRNFFQQCLSSLNVQRVTDNVGAQCEYFAGIHARRENRAKMPSTAAAFQLDFEVKMSVLVNYVFAS